MSYQNDVQTDTTETNQDVEEYQDQYQDQLDKQEDQQDLIEQQELYESAGAEVPVQKRPESLFALFQRVWNTSDSSKVANLSSMELGKLNISVRDTQYLSLLGRTLHHNSFAGFFKSHGEITLSTSASKKGWFTELFVSQKKFTTRSSSSGNQTQQPKKKWTLFGASNATSESENF